QPKDIEKTITMLNNKKSMWLKRRGLGGVYYKKIEEVNKSLQSNDEEEKAEGFLKAGILIDNIQYRLTKKRNFTILMVTVNVVGLSALSLSIGSGVIGGAYATPLIVASIVAGLGVTTLVFYGMYYKKRYLATPADPTSQQKEVQDYRLYQVAPKYLEGMTKSDVLKNKYFGAKNSEEHVKKVVRRTFLQQKMERAARRPRNRKRLNSSKRWDWEILTDI
ncbi:MAG: hypothetical protein ACQEP8_06545, partial [Chlamydiota bacterium]